MILSNFKIGQVVYLLSNKSIQMIIERIDTTRNMIVCGWIGEDGKLLSGIYKPYQLGKVSDLNRKTIAI